MSKPVEIATSNDVTDVKSFSELLQLPVDEKVIPTQLSFSPVKPKRKATPIQAAHNELEMRSIIVYGVPQSKAEVAADRVRHDIKSLESYFKCDLAKAESITLYKAYRVGTHDSNSTDRPGPVKIILGSVEEKLLLLNRRKMLYLIMPDYFFHQSYNRAERLKYRALKEELHFRKDQGEKDLAIKNGTITVKKLPHKNFLWRTPVMMTGK